VEFHHDSHVHPFLPSTSGVTQGVFVIPTVGESSRNVFYRILLTVRDSRGFTHVSSRDILPAPLDVPATLPLENAAKRTGFIFQGELGGVWLLDGAASVSDQFSFPAPGQYSFRIGAQGSYGGGAWPIAGLLIDGQLAGQVTVDSTALRTYELVVPVPAGTHQVGVAFLNDYYSVSPPGDRNLGVGSLAISAATVAPPATITLEAEEMPVRQVEYWAIHPVGSFLFGSEGSIGQDVLLPSPGSYLVGLTAASFGNAGGRQATLEIRVDGRSVGQISGLSYELATYYLTVPVPSSGTHRIEIAFVNDFYAPPLDLNAIADKLTLRKL
jgi:hypothetical protein